MTVSSNQRRYPAFPETMGSDNSIRSNPPKVGFSIRHAPTIGASRRNACQHGRMSLADEAKGLYHYNATDRADVVVVVIGGQGSRYAYNTGSQITTETACHGQRLDDSNPLAMDRTLRFSTTFSDHPADAVQCKYAYDNPRVADWLARDPLVERVDINLYSHVRNTPTLFIDAHGQFTITAHPAPGYESGASLGDCGNFVYEIVWQIAPDSDPDKGGTIVQYVNVSFDIELRDGQSFTPSRPDPNWWPFYESWGIRKDNDITGSIPDDRFSMPQISTCSRGTIVIDAAVTYYNGKENPPPGFVATGEPPGGRLPVSRNPPPTEWGEGDGWLTRRVVATWDCCSGHGKTSVSIQ